MTALRRLHSWLRFAWGMPRLLRTGQIGDGREAACAAFVEADARPGDAANAEVARRIWAHAGVGDRITCVVGTIGDGGTTLDALERDHGVDAGTVDLLFVDHDKKAYLPDLLAILQRGWLHPGSIAVADNVRVPGAPRYRSYMHEQEGRHWRTVEHRTHVEYQKLLPDLVLESQYLS